MEPTLEHRNVSRPVTVRELQGRNIGLPTFHGATIDSSSVQHLINIDCKTVDMVCMTPLRTSGDHFVFAKRRLQHRHVDPIVGTPTPCVATRLPLVTPPSPSYRCVCDEEGVCVCVSPAFGMARRTRGMAGRALARVVWDHVPTITYRKACLWAQPHTRQRRQPLL